MDIDIYDIFSIPVLAIIFVIIICTAAKRWVETNIDDDKEKFRIYRSFIIAISIPIIVMIIGYFINNSEINSIWESLNSKKIDFSEEQDPVAKMNRIIEKYKGEQSGRKVNKLIDELIRLGEEVDRQNMPAFKLFTTLDKRERGKVEGFEATPTAQNYVDELKTMQYRVMEGHKYFVVLSYDGYDSVNKITITFDASQKGYDGSEIELN